MTEQEKQEIFEALRCCVDAPFGYEPCPLSNEPIRACYELRQKADKLIKSMSAELEQVKQDRDAWKRRAEAAVRDMDKSCVVCKYYAEEKCVKPMGCFNYTGTNVGWEWRGPCAENGGTENGL